MPSRQVSSELAELVPGPESEQVPSLAKRQLSQHKHSSNTADGGEEGDGSKAPGGGGDCGTMKRDSEATAAAETATETEMVKLKVESPTVSMIS